MGLNNNQRRIAAWIACFVILLASLAPSISRALAAGIIPPAFGIVSQEEQEECPQHHFHADGTEGHSHAGHGPQHVPGLAQADSGSHSGHSPESGMHLDHCPFCFTHAGSFGLPPAMAPDIPMVTGSSILPVLFFQSPRPLFAWIAAQPRAPPIIS